MTKYRVTFSDGGYQETDGAEVGFRYGALAYALLLTFGGMRFELTHKHGGWRWKLRALTSKTWWTYWRYVLSRKPIFSRLETNK